MGMIPELVAFKTGSYWVGHNKLLDFHWGILNPFLKEAIAIKKNPTRCALKMRIG